MSAWTNRETILREVSDRWCLTGVVFCPHTLVIDEKDIGITDDDGVDDEFWWMWWNSGLGYLGLGQFLQTKYVSP